MGIRKSGHKLGGDKEIPSKPKVGGTPVIPMVKPDKDIGGSGGAPVEPSPQLYPDGTPEPGAPDESFYGGKKK